MFQNMKKSEGIIANIFKSLKGKIRMRKVKKFYFLNFKGECFALNNWITALFNIGRRQPFYNVFGRRRNNRGMMWGSLLGLGVSAAAYGIRRSRNRNLMQPIQNLMNKTGMGNVQKPNMAGLTEFAKEIVPNKNPLNNK